MKMLNVKCRKVEKNYQAWIEDFAFIFYENGEEYYLLELEDWNLDSIENIFEKNENIQGSSIIVMKDDVITKHNVKGKFLSFGLKFVGKDGKQKIRVAYNKWKKEHESIQ